MGSRERSDWLPMLPSGQSHPCLRRWRSISQRGMWPDDVVVDAPAFGQHAQFFDRVEDLTVEEFVPEFGVERFAVAVLPWEPGSMYSVFAPVSASHLRRSLATNSGPLPDRRCSGTPFSTMTSASAPITFVLDQRRSARISRHSRVDSSIRLSIAHYGHRAFVC